MNTIPFFPQERPESCAPACLRMVLAYHGREYTEAELYACCETDIDGTLPSAVAHCAERLGCDASAPRLSGLDPLKESLADYTFPIVFVNLSPVLGVNVIQAVIIETLDEQAGQVQVIDPAFPPTGRRIFSLSMFETAWRSAQYQTILVAPKS